MRIPLFRPRVSEEGIQAVAEVLRSGWLGLGPRTKEFEERFAEYLGASHCVGLNSCTGALHLALRLLDLPKGSEVITTAISFVSTSMVALYEGARPVFADIQPDTGNLDVSSVRDKITDKTGAIILVHYGGYPCDLDEFYELSAKTGVPLIEDCAHSCGATYRGSKVGGNAEIAAFSFHAVKPLPMGDGGALILGSEKRAERAKRLRWLGIDSDTFQRTQEKSYKWEYEVTEVGFKYHMNDIQAAMGLAQLPYVDQEIDRRVELAELYLKQLTGASGIKTLDYEDDRKSSYHLFPVLAEDRNALVDKLSSKEIDVGVHYRRNDVYPMFEEADLPNTEAFWRSVVSLPIHNDLTDENVEYIAAVINEGW